MSTSEEWPATTAPAELLVEELLASEHTVDTTEIPRIVNRYAVATGLDGVFIHLADVQQNWLISLTGDAELPIESSTAGLAYRTSSVRVVEAADGCHTVWLPLLEGADRVGVLGVRTRSLEEPVLARCRRLAALIAAAITAKHTHSDTLTRLTRSRPMLLPAEMVRTFLPPRTLGTDQVTSTAVLEPAYEVGGDAFDHAISGEHLSAAILDAMGHDLASGLASSVAIAGGRNARRNGADLPGLVSAVDGALTKWVPDRFCTGVFVRLHLPTGVMRWVNCGHPPPLLIRDYKVIDGAFERDSEPPLGVAASLLAGNRTIHRIRLEPGDRVLLYTDGVVEARSEDGDEFGLERFTDFIVRAAMADESAPETLRRLIHALLRHRDHRLSDDVCILLIEWRPGEV
ncbi:MAG: PP2C family protein-serine/threonine phosphatase [Nocardiopsaceae bacterium]|nr:PP2C family protein-serine/threonine phosphatase [Nocardiopsaceae bacterium]